MSERPLSPIVLFKTLLETEMDPDVPSDRIVIGPAKDAQQQAGCIQLMSAGLPRKEAYLPLIWQRVQIRCVARTLLDAEIIAGLLFVRVDNTNRVIVPQSSNGHEYLVHWVSLEGGPSMHFDTPETWEVLVFAELMVGTEPVS